jgi:predicted membrane metal-binding protein
LFVSGIGHVLSISGYHMSVVAGLIFFVLRAFFALISGLADRAPIKKWAAFAALMVTGFYLGGDATLVHHDRARFARCLFRPSHFDHAHAHGGGK